MAKLNKALGMAGWVVLGIRPKGSTISRKNSSAKKKPPIEGIDPTTQQSLPKTPVAAPAVDSKPQLPSLLSADSSNTMGKNPVANNVPPVNTPSALPAELTPEGLKPSSPAAVLVQNSPIPLEVEPAAIPKPLPLESVMDKQPEAVDVIQPLISSEPNVRQIADISDITGENHKIKMGDQTVLKRGESVLSTALNGPAEKPVETDSKPEEKSQSKEKSEDSPKDEGKDLIADLFKQVIEDQVSPLDLLIKSLPESSVDELLAETKEVEFMLREYLENHK